MTIPQSLRKKYNLKAGAQVDFVQQSETSIGLVVRRRKKRSSSGGKTGQDAFSAWFEQAVGSAGPGLTTDELMAITRGED